MTYDDFMACFQGFRVAFLRAMARGQMISW
jgi:hypothetical protein